MEFEGASYDELMKAIVGRRAVRMIKYADVPDEIIIKILEAGRWGPTGGNLQPWSFLVVRDREKVRRVGEIYMEFNRLRLGDHKDRRNEDFPSDSKRFYSDAGCQVLIMGDARILAFYPYFRESRYDETIEKTLRNLSQLDDINEFFYTKGVVPRGGIEIWLSSIAACIQNMQLAVSTLGYATTWLTVRTYQDKLFKELFEIPEHYHVIAVMPIGIAGERFKTPRYRKTLEHFTHHDVFKKEKDVTDDELNKWATAVRGQRMRPDNQVIGLPHTMR